MIIGLDLGGAHLKSALLDELGRVRAVRQLPCPLWQGLDHLRTCLARVLAEHGTCERVALTMTGELCDLFGDRAQGVREILAETARLVDPSRIRVLAQGPCFLDVEQAKARPLEVASANWLASAALVAAQLDAALLIDMGSTTTDILPVARGGILALAKDDAGRLAAGELVYTGLTRTPLMAVAATLPYAGRTTPVMAEHFATMADVHRLLGQLDEAHDQHAAADNGAKTPEASARRLARMVGADAGACPPHVWIALAAHLARLQRRQIEDAIALRLSQGDLPMTAPLVTAGCGAAILHGLDLGRQTLSLAELLPTDDPAWTNVCAPAVAAAWLLRRFAS